MTFTMHSVNKSMVDTVAANVAGHKAHQRMQDFEAEPMELLRGHGIEFDASDIFG